MHSHICNICLSFRPQMFVFKWPMFHVSGSMEQNSYEELSLGALLQAFLLKCMFSNGSCPKGCKDAKSHCLHLLDFFSTVRFQMYPKIVCICLVIQSLSFLEILWVAKSIKFSFFIWHEKMPQIACMRKCIVILVAFFLLFSTVRFQLSPQITCMRKCIVTLVAFL